VGNTNQTISKHQKRRQEPERTWPNTPDQKQPYGTNQKLVENGTGNMPTKVSSSTKTYQTVYNISVSEEPEYLANGILVHNCDSWALAEWAYARYNEDNNASVAFISHEKERKVAKNDDGEVTDYWPGMD